MILQLSHISFPSSSYCERRGSFYYSQSLLALAPMRIRCLRRSEASIPVGVSKIWSDAQEALFDYLHGTRGFSFLDAEHISRNSPRFLKRLLSNIKIEEDVTGALSRFLRYYPINEFEPFFESLGLSPNDLASLLPQKLTFLSDDHTLLDNYHILRDYGIPHSKIGKMYKEAAEIFRYGDGVLNKKLRVYEQLGLSQSTVVNLVSCCPTLLVGCKSNEFFLVLEKLKELELGADQNGSCLSSKHSYDWGRIIDTMCFLYDLGYSDAQMGTLFKANPALLFEGKRAYILVGQLVKVGLSTNRIGALFSEYPMILTPKYAKRVWEAMHFLLQLGMDTENITKIVSTRVRLIGSQPLKRRSILKNFKGGRHSLCRSIQEDPMNLFRLASEREIRSRGRGRPTNLASSLEKKAFLLKLGYVENSDEMTKALSLIDARGDQLQDRFDCLVEAGLDHTEVIYMFRKAPNILSHTREEIQKKIEMLDTYLGYSVKSIVHFPRYITYNRDRIIRRFSMYAWAKKKGAVKPNIAVSTLVAYSHPAFVKYFVDVHPEGPDMWKSLKKLETKSTEKKTNVATYLEKKAFLLRLGYVENSDEMTKALRLVLGRGDQLQDRFDCLVEAGLDHNDVIYMFRKSPKILNSTREEIQKKIESLDTYLGYSVKSIVRFPTYITYSRDRINCRFSMYAWAKKKGVVKGNIAVSTLIACVDVVFVKYFVDVHPEGPAKWKSLKKSFNLR